MNILNIFKTAYQRIARDMLNYPFVCAPSASLMHVYVRLQRMGHKHYS